MTNELPITWTKCTVKDLCSISTGKLDANAAKDDGDYPFFTCALKPSKIDTYVFDGKCVYVPGNGANVGFVGYYEGKFNAYQRTYVLHDIGIHEKYLYYGLLLNWNHYNKDKQFGVATNFIRLANLEEYPINLPPLAEQKRIVGKIEELFAEVDKGIDLLKQKQAELKKYRQSVLSAAFSGKLYKTTKWQIVALKDVCEKITDGSHNPPPKQTTGIPMLSGQNIKNDTINFDDFRFISQKDYEREAKRAPISKNDVLLTIVGTIGQSAVVPESLGCFAIQRSIALIKPTTINSYFLKYYFDSPEAQYFFKQKERGTAQKGIYLTTLKEMSVPFPVHSEQEQIVAEIEQRFGKADILEKSIENALESAEKLKQSILKKAFEGKLVPQNPNDEPASVLLERIKSEQPPKKGKRK